MTQERLIIEIDEDLCDGCGECVSACHEGALKIVDGKARLVSETLCDGLGACLGDCPRGALKVVQKAAPPFVAPPEEPAPAGPVLSHWPIQIRLARPDADFLQGAELVVAADCVPVACPTFHREFVRGHAVLIGCPKFDDLQDYAMRFARIFSASEVKRVNVVVMQVPCCQSLPLAVLRGLELAGKTVPVEKTIVGIYGQVLETAPLNETAAAK